MGFDDFARRRDEDKHKRDRLANEIGSEWEILKGFVQQFALDRKSFDGHTFEWGSDLTGLPLLVLNFVSATLYEAQRAGTLPEYRVIFSRKPAGPGRIYPDDSPLPKKTWHLKADIARDGQFVWLVDEEERGGPKRSSAKLADAIAEELARYHIEYDRAYGRAS